MKKRKQKKEKRKKHTQKNTLLKNQSYLEKKKIPTSMEIGLYQPPYKSHIPVTYNLATYFCS